MQTKVKIGQKSFDYFEEAQGYFKGFLDRTSLDVPFASKSKLKTGADLPQTWWTPIIRSIETVEVFYENEEKVYGRVQG